jgi:hypothetical protein
MVVMVTRFCSFLSQAVFKALNKSESLAQPGLFFDRLLSYGKMLKHRTPEQRLPDDRLFYL